MNKVQISGTMEGIMVRTLKTGKSMVTFTIISRRTWQHADGSDHADAEYHRCVAWDNIANDIQANAKEQSKVYAEGYLKTRSWVDEHGVKKYMTEIIVERFTTKDIPE